MENVSGPKSGKVYEKCYVEHITNSLDVSLNSQNVQFDCLNGAGCKRVNQSKRYLTLIQLTGCLAPPAPMANPGNQSRIVQITWKPD